MHRPQAESEVLEQPAIPYWAANVEQGLLLLTSSSLPSHISVWKLTCTPPWWKVMDMEPLLDTSELSRVISVFTKSMKVSRSVLTPLPLARTAKALQHTASG